MMYGNLIYVAESDAAWVDSGKEKTTNPCKVSA